MAASSSQGINTLLEAEREASTIVDQAREYRVAHLKEARDEAAKDISRLRAQKNEELAAIQKESADQTELTENIRADTAAKLAATKEQFETNRQAAVDKLVEAVASSK